VVAKECRDGYGKRSNMFDRGIRESEAALLPATERDD
jgi:hypothetical protein